MNFNSPQINWILTQIEQTGYLLPDDLRNYFDDKKLSKRHLESITKSINYLIREKWLKKRKGRLLFTTIGERSWKLAKLPKLKRYLVKYDTGALISEWDVFATKPRKIDKYQYVKRTVINL